VELTPIDARDANEIEHTIAGSATGGVIVTASPSAFRGRDLIIALAARHRLPAVYPTPRWAADGGLISYGPDEIDQHRRAVCYAGGRYATAGASLSSH
jgi:putative ABC transport system substrate-binding protein